MSNRFSYKGYQAKYEWDEDGKFYHGQIANLTDIVTFHAKTLDKLKKEMVISVEDYLEFCQEEGKEPERPYSGTFNVRIKPEVHKAIAQKATRQGVSINRFVAEIIKKEVLGTDSGAQEAEQRALIENAMKSLQAALKTKKPKAAKSQTV